MPFYSTIRLHRWLYAISYTTKPEPMAANRITNCYLCVGEAGALLYDTGFGFAPLIPEIRKITGLPITVVLGHGHGDHAGGAYEFERAYIHPDDIELCLRHTSRTARRNILAIPRTLPEGFDEDAYIHAGCCELVPLEQGQVFDLGGLTMEVIPMEGHSAGSVGLLAQEHKVLLDSDAANHLTWMFLRESLPMADYINMLRRINGMDVDTIYCAHCVSPIPKSDLQKYITCAENINPANTKPFHLLTELGGKVYHHDGAAIIFNESKL